MVFRFPSCHIAGIDTPLGLMYAGVSEAGLHCLSFFNPLAEGALRGQAPLDAASEAARCLAETERQLAAYFEGRLRQFSLPLVWGGTAFQQAAWRILLTIPYGYTCSYAGQAERAGCPRAVRAIANANRLNPWAIVVPCHRVVGSNGALTGYAGGLPRKQFLLEHERKVLLQG